MHTVGEGFFGLMVDFEEEAIGADGDGGAGEGKNFVAFAGAMAGINEDGEMAAFFHCRDDGEVESIAGKIGEGANAALAKHDVVVALGEDIFRGHEEFVESGGHAAFKKDGEFGAASSLEEREVLHVARADLNDVGVMLHQRQRLVVHRFGDDKQTEVFTDFCENL